VLIPRLVDLLVAWLVNMVEDFNIGADQVVGGDNCHIGLLEQGYYFVEDGKIEIGM
jgi:hypothetical protein